MVGIFYIGYQILAFKDSHLFTNHDNESSVLFVLNTLLSFMKDNPSVWVLIIFIIFLGFIFYTFSPVLCGWSLIDLISKKIANKKLAWGLARWLETFFPLFEFAAITAPFSIMTFLTETSLVLRNFSTWLWVFAIPVLTAILVVWTFLSLLFIFAEQYIVIENYNVINAMKRSTLLVLSNVKDIMFLGIAMALIAAKIIINILLILIIPFIFFGIITLMAMISLQWLWVIIGIIVSIAMIITATYLITIFNIFSYAVWTISFIHFRKKEEEQRLVKSD